MTISVINGGGVVTKSRTLFRVLVVLAILTQAGLVAHNANDPVRQPQTAQQQ